MSSNFVAPAGLLLAHKLHILPCLYVDRLCPPAGLLQAVSPAGLLPFTLGQVYQVISPYTNKLDNVVELHSKIVAPTLPGTPPCVLAACTRPNSCPSSCRPGLPSLTGP